MKEELRTLKDLENESDSYGDDSDKLRPLIDGIELRQEAIRWIREIRRIQLIGNSPVDVLSFKVDGKEIMNAEYITDLDGAEKVLMMFFNITEDDLK